MSWDEIEWYVKRSTERRRAEAQAVRDAYKKG